MNKVTDNIKELAYLLKSKNVDKENVIGICLFIKDDAECGKVIDLIKCMKTFNLETVYEALIN